MNLTEVNNLYQTYTAPSGREFKTIGIEQMPNTQKWVNGAYKALFRVLIRYEEGRNMKWLYFDYNDELVKTENFV